MKKLLSLILALIMLMTVAPVFAEATAEKNGLSSLFSRLMSGSSEDTEGSRLGNLFNHLKGKLDDSESSFSLSSLLRPLLTKLRGIKGIKLSVIINAVKDKFGGLLGGLSRGSEGGGEGTSLSSLLGGLLGGDSSEDGVGTDLSGMLSGLLGGEGDGSEGGKASELLSLLSGLLGGGDEGSEGSEDGELLSLLGSLFGDGEGDEDIDLDKLLEEYRSSPEYQEYMARYAALKDYLNAEYAEALEQGDVQVFTESDISNFDNDDPNVEFGYFALANYTADGKDLKLLNYAGNMELLTYEKQEDGTYKVVEAIAAEEGDDYEPSIEKMCEAFGIPYSDYTDHMMWKDFDEVIDMYRFMKDHPEYERIEYMGELRTPEELDGISDAIFDETEALILGESAEAE